MDLVVIGTPGCRRVALFQGALARLGHRPARVVSYLDLLDGRIQLSDVVVPSAVVRVESPGKEFEVERALLAAGEDEAEEEGAARISRPAVAALAFDRGRLLYPRQWYLGFCRTLALIEAQLATCPNHHRMNSPADVALMFDKVRCHRLLADAGIPVPHGLGVAVSFEDLWQRLRASGCRRVFVKLAHGSCASGVVAYQTDGVRHLATTTVERVRHGDEWRLYNTRRLRQYRQPAEIAALIDALCRHRAHVEEWLPKAGIEGRTFDLRVVVIDGVARHTVVRKSRGPMTNLHLLNRRGDTAAARARMGEAAWAAAWQTCEVATRCFPGSLYAGVDLLVTPDFRRHAVLEMNAFGDLLPDLWWDGQDTYGAEILALGVPPRSLPREGVA